MSSTVVQNPLQAQEYVIVPAVIGSGYHVTVNGVYLTNRFGVVREFATRSSARKQITRERRGNSY